MTLQNPSQESQVKEGCILAVDDSQTILSLIGVHCRALGREYVPVRVQKSDDVIQLLREVGTQHHPALMIVDLNMPVGGKELVRVFRGREREIFPNATKRVPIMIYSSESQDMVRAVAEELGVPYALKTDPMGTFIGIVLDLLAGRVPVPRKLT